MRLYSRDELERLRVIKRLVDDLGINLAGVQRLLSIAEVVQRIRPLMRDEPLSSTRSRAGSTQERRSARASCWMAATDDGIQGLLRHARRHKTRHREGNQAGLPEAGAQASSRTSTRATRPPRRSSRRSTRPTRCSAIPRSARSTTSSARTGVPTNRPAPGGPGATAAAGTSTSAAARPGGGFRTMTQEEMHEMFGDGDPFSDFFHTFFGGARRRRAGSGARRRAGRGRRAQGRDVEQEIELSLEDAFHGTTRRLSIKHDGHARTVDVRIPPASATDRGCGFRAKATSDRRRASPATCTCASVSRRIRSSSARARTSTRRSAVPLTTAVLGGEADVPTLAGKSLRLKVPAATQNGQMFRLKGHGMPTANKTEAGDLYATVEIQLPKT